MPSLATKLQGVKLPKFNGPLWKGPEVDGVTQSLLGRFLFCRERFRLLVVHGLKPAKHFEPRIEYGNMWHLCEECHANNETFETKLLAYCKVLVMEYRSQQAEVEKWYNVCRVQFPLYVKFWQQHKQNSTPLLQEFVFKIPYKLPSGRTILLRGKWDSVDLVGKKFIWLQENKTKAQIDVQRLQSQLTFDLQTMFYLVALQQASIVKHGLVDQKLSKTDLSLAGVRYNVVRRPLAGGAGTIVRHKATQGSKCPKCKGAGSMCPKCLGVGRIGAKPEETLESYYSRLADIIKADTFDAKGKPIDNNSYFARWDCQVSQYDIKCFEQQFLIPVGEQLCNWWQYINDCPDCNPWKTPKPSECLKGYFHGLHFRFPYGVWNPLTDGNGSDLDEYLANGSEVGLQRTDNLFPELS